MFNDPRIPADYAALIARIESNNRPYARNPRSTASGLYQFVRSTWEQFGGRWGSQSGVAFGGLHPSVEEQNDRFLSFTSENADLLERWGIAINNATLYAAHFLGASGARGALSADPSTPITQVTSADQRRANPTILRGTVGDFFAWLEGKTGTHPLAVAQAAHSVAECENCSSLKESLLSILETNLEPGLMELRKLLKR